MKFLKMVSLVGGLALTLSASQAMAVPEAAATSFNAAEVQSMFVPTVQPAQLAALSRTEMKATEGGAYLWTPPSWAYYNPWANRSFGAWR